MQPFFGEPFFGGGFFGELTRPGGTSKRDKKKKRVIRRSELAIEEYEAELQALASEITIRSYVEPETDDDEILLTVLARVLH
jgi:hypothetical protein